MTRENNNDNNLFYVCSLIEYLARKTKNTKADIVKMLGINKINKIYNLAEVYHSEFIDKITDELIYEYQIKNGNYNIIKDIDNIPSYYDIGRVYQRLIIMLSNNESEYISKLYEVLTSWIIPKIDNYNSSLYYENPEYIYECYKANKII